MPKKNRVMFLASSHFSYASGLGNELSAAGYEVVSCYQDTFGSDPDRAAEWLATGQDISAIVIDKQDDGGRLSSSFVAAVISTLKVKTTCPIFVLGKGKSEDNLFWTQPEQVIQALSEQLED